MTKNIVTVVPLNVVVAAVIVVVIVAAEVAVVALHMKI